MTTRPADSSTLTVLQQLAGALASATRHFARRIVLEAVVCLLRLRGRGRGRFERNSGAREIAVIGFLEAASGLGTTARGLLVAIESLGPTPISVSQIARTPLIPSVRVAHETGSNALFNHYRVGLHVYNPDVFLRLILTYGGKLVHRNRMNIAVVYWETQRLPSSWPRVLSLYDRLVAPSKFTADAVSRGTGRTVHVLPNCVSLRPIRVRARTDSHFEFLCLFDVHSDCERKNPLATIRAFRLSKRGLPPAVTCRLRVKCHADTPSAVVSALRAEAGDAPIEIMAETLSDDGMQRLWEECDCLVSLHRSEGFGLPVAEALARGIPVVATRQGGILDFVNDQGGLLVDGVPAVRPAASGASVYHEWSGWIDPDIPSAAAALRRVMSHYDTEVARAREGRERLREYTSPDAVLKAYLAAVSDGSVDRDA